MDADLDPERVRWAVRTCKDRASWLAEKIERRRAATGAESPLTAQQLIALRILIRCAERSLREWL